MAEEEEHVETPEAEETPQADAPEEAAAEAPAEEPDAGSGTDAADAGSGSEAAEADEPATDEVPDPPAADEVPDPATGAVEEPSEPEETLSPKERRKRDRSTHTGEARPQRSSEERANERVETRRANAAARSRRRAQERAKRGESGQGTAPAEREPGVRKAQLGTVVSDKADKTITVRVDIVRRHRRYEKVVRQSATVHAHDERNEASAGDVVRVVESRPLSRTKRWRLVEVVEKAR